MVEKDSNGNYNIIVDSLTFFNFFISNYSALEDLSKLIKVTKCSNSVGAVEEYDIISFTTLKSITFTELLKIFNDMNIDLEEELTTDDTYISIIDD